MYSLGIREGRVVVANSKQGAGLSSGGGGLASLQLSVVSDPKRTRIV